MISLLISKQSQQQLLTAGRHVSACPIQIRLLTLRQNESCRHPGVTPGDAEVLLEVQMKLVQRPQNVCRSPNEGVAATPETMFQNA